MRDLFAIENEFQPLDLPDASVSYLPRLLLATSPDELTRELIDTIPWESKAITLWGKQYLQPRLIAWFGDAEARYTYSGLSLEPRPWTDRLAEIRTAVEQASSTTFNSVLLNYYRNERDRMGMHSDDEPELGRNPVIASVSLGAERTFVLKHKSRRDLKTVRLTLGSGSLLLMQGPTQHHWKHGLEVERTPCGPRINLTFRKIGKV
jgi:alkylated DNA repair dioxygenase AlkB